MNVTESTPKGASLTCPFCERSFALEGVSAEELWAGHEAVCPVLHPGLYEDDDD